MKVLIVEDNAVSQKLALTILTKAGYEVETANSGKEAVSILEDNGSVDIILTDIIMPVMDGFHLLTYLKADPKRSRIPVILCSSLNDLASVKKGISLGAVDYVIKPMDPPTLLKKIKNAEKKIVGAVLVVDDEPLLRKLLTNIFEREGLKVLPAASAKEALQSLETNRISVVISDVVMPEMNGLELLAQVKDKHPHVPVLLVTGQSGSHSRHDCISAGADGYLTKPFKNVEIMGKVAPYVQ